MNAIETRELTKQYRGGRTAVDRLSVTVGEGEFFALLGANGAGKTTAIKMLCCLLRPTAGDALVLGDSITDRPEAVKQKLGISPQETAVAPNLTVRENLELAAALYGFPRALAREKAQRMLTDFALGDREKDRAKTLSGGYQRRLSLAMALVSDPRVLFLDEPTLGLDVRARRELWKHIEQLKGRVTIVLTTHYLEEAQALADRIAIMNAGTIRALGTAEEIEKQAGAASLEDAFLALTDGGEIE
ncbi:MAG: ABC transporter ATP-binding protein [Oscillospiraceae bacterium]|nr:ABC transporter ATP-binding protein [Oscillospiraceae bacterium]